MPPRNIDREKLALLKKLTAEGLSQLDRGEGIVVNSKGQLTSTIARIGRRAAGKNKRPQSSR